MTTMQLATAAPLLPHSWYRKAACRRTSYTALQSPSCLAVIIMGNLCPITVAPTPSPPWAPLVGVYLIPGYR